MSAVSVDVKKKSKPLSSLELNSCSKEELIERIIQLEAHNSQLKNIINKRNLPNVTEDHSKKQKRSFDFTRCKKEHILLKLIYLGWDYQGFASQEDTNETIEHHLFQALTKSCLIENRQTSNYHRCGRTDKGVSSFGQVISLTVRSADNDKPQLDYCKILNRLLPKEIRILAWRPIRPDFSARFNCTKRTYKYFFPRGNLNLDAMQAAAQYLEGTHDFRNLCKMDVGNGVINFTRCIYKADIEIVSENTWLDSKGYDMCVFTLEGQGYLWHQIRCIMGLLFLVGDGKESPCIIEQLLDINTQPKKPQYAMALDIPLNLFHCTFDFDNIDGDWIIDLQSLTEVVKTLQHIWSLLAVKETMVATMLKDIQRNTPDIQVTNQASCLLQGVRSKIYVPVLKRPMCESLESRIEHYVKKRRLEVKTT